MHFLKKLTGNKKKNNKKIISTEQLVKPFRYSLMASFVSRLGSTVMNSGCSGGRDFMASGDTKRCSQINFVMERFPWLSQKQGILRLWQTQNGEMVTQPQEIFYGSCTCNMVN